MNLQLTNQVLLKKNAGPCLQLELSTIGSWSRLSSLDHRQNIDGKQVRNCIHGVSSTMDTDCTASYEIRGLSCLIAAVLAESNWLKV